MADKLTELSWVAFAKNELTKEQRALLDDATLVKALAALEKAGEDKPGARTQALDDLIAQIKKQITALAKVKKQLGDKPFNAAKDKLYGLLDAAETQHKAAVKAGDEDGDEEESSPALLTTKMVPLLKELRKGEAPMHALICTAGKSTALLIMRRAIAPARRKLLAEAVDAKGGAKYIVGECRYEENVLTFVVQAPAAGLAKRLRQALLDQTEQRLKVKVRGEDGEESDGESEGREPEGESVASARMLAYLERQRRVQERVGQALRAQHPESTRLRALVGFASEKADAEKDYAAAAKALDKLEQLLDAPAVAADQAAGADPGAAFNARLAALMPRVKQAMAGGGPAGQDIKLKVSEAGVFARKRDFAAAKAALDEAEVLLHAAGDAAPAQTDAAGEAASGDTRPTFVGYAKARLAWLETRQQVAAELQRLERAILEAYADSSASGTAQAATRSLDEVLKVLDERLADKLDEGLNATDPATRQSINRQAAEIIGRYQRFIHASPLMRQVDDNPFVAVNVQERLATTLDDLERQLG